MRRLFREHMDPVFRAKLKKNLAGGALRVSPTPQGGGGRPGFLPEPASMELYCVYIYDGFNRRTMSVVVGESETQFHTYDGWRQVGQYEMDSFSAKPVKQFVWGSQLDELVSYRRLNGSAWESYYVLHGGQDTAARLLDQDGNVVERYEYDPYGRVTAYTPDGGGGWNKNVESSYGLPFLWKGIRLDSETGLLYMRNRYYSTETGRFLSVDPLGIWADAINSGSGYAYGGCRPGVFGDPMGLQGGGPPTTHVIVSSFGPFGGASTNSSQAAADAANTAMQEAGIDTTTVNLSVVFDKSADEIDKEIKEIKEKDPSANVIWVAFGQGSRWELEGRGSNKRGLWPDNEGQVPGQGGVPAENDPGGPP